MPSRLAIIPDCAFTRKLDDVFSAVARERLPSFDMFSMKMAG